MTKLNQIIAVEPRIKSTAHQAFTAVHKQNQKAALFAGLNRTYVPKDDDGDQLPAESTMVQLTVKDQLEQASAALADLFDITFTKDVANTLARADVVVNDELILANVPVTHLLFLEKQLTDLHTFVSNLPTLDPSVQWTLNTDTGVYQTDPVKTVKTKKVPRNHVLAEATDKHPAQVELFHEDVVVGTWTKVDTSGAIPLTRKRELLQRIDALQNAVKFAREEANSTEVASQKIADKVFNFLFA